MKLKATLPIRGDRIDYTFNPTSGVHQLWFAMAGALYSSQSAGDIANYLAPYREQSEDVRDLFAWLCK